MQMTADEDLAVYGDAYVTHFCRVLRAVAVDRADLRALHCPREIELATRFLDELSPLAKHVYARVFQRKGPWFKTVSLLGYFVPRRHAHRADGTLGEGSDDASAVISLLTDEDDEEEEESQDKEATCHGSTEQDKQEHSAAGDEAASAVSDRSVTVALDDAVVQHTLQMLVNAGLLVTLPLLSPALLSREEQEAQLQLSLEVIEQCASAPELSALHKKLTGGKSRALANRSRGASSSPSGAGAGTTKAEVFGALRRHVLSQRRIDGSRIPIAKMLHNVWRQHSRMGQHASLDDIIFAVRLEDDARRLFLRMHRLYYFQSALPPSPTPVLSAANRVKAFRDILKERLESRPASAWPGLMTTFKKVKYPEYAISISNPIFLSSEAYMCHEIAGTMRQVVNALEQEMVLEQASTEDEDAICQAVFEGVRTI
ncbi:hypothetical protein ATCC90586_008747 [Pythium insidiosum]|nr:hypothetical protein ATCC90586_008747 [Pythium insidiosum]